MWLTRWPEQGVITLQPKAKATHSMFSSRTMAISLQCKIENVLHSYAGTLLFPVPAFPTANTEWHSAGSSSSWTTYHTEGIHSERLSSPVVLLITETQLFTRVISPSYTPIPFNRKKNEPTSSQQICLSWADVASSNIVWLPENGKRVCLN